VSRTEDASLRTVVVAVAANLLVAVAKAVAARTPGEIVEGGPSRAPTLPSRSRLTGEAPMPAGR
jgi:hypothetical protein